MPEYSYAQLIELDMTAGGLTKKQAVLSRTLDRRFKASAKRVLAGKAGACRMDQRCRANLFDFLADTPPY